LHVGAGFKPALFRYPDWMKDWKKIAEGNNLGIPDADLDRIRPSLDQLEATFRPLAGSIPHEVEPAITFVIPPEAAE
jgi:hypothetical protein